MLARFTTEENQVALEEKQLALERAQRDFTLGKQQRQDQIKQAEAALNGLSSYEARIQALNNAWLSVGPSAPSSDDRPDENR